MMLGFAWQKGWIPLGLASLMRAMELNAVAVANNKAAFEWGRRAAVDWPSVQRALQPAQVIQFTPRSSQTLEQLVARRVEFLTQYQNAAYAQTYVAFVEQVREAESAVGGSAAAGGSGAARAALAADLPLTQAVARYLFKLMAYKDEYEVARLHTDAAFLNKINAMFEGDFQIRHHLAPPLLAGKNDAGELQKSAFGLWVRTAFRLLAPLKVLRGTALDVFGYSEERRIERALVAEYRSAIASLLPGLNVSNLEAAAAFARVPEQIRGYGHVKARHLAAARAQWALLLERCHQADPGRQARAA
jgi:indolepyruvate ferredoxin oxidoreductase